ncbi:N-6 DNA methylase, partial [Cutibacterium acnes]
GVLEHIDFTRKVGQNKIPDIKLRQLITHFGTYRLRNEDFEFPDLLGAAYEYLIGEFADSAGKKGGEFYTPRSVVRMMVRLIKPSLAHDIYDPCCGSGGMFVQSEKFVQEHGGRIGDIAIYGQESNYTTWRLCKMNLAVRSIDADIRWNNEGSFHKDELPDLRADFILANPPFNI